MAKAAAKQTPGEILDQLKTQFVELRQTEALESQLHEMVVAKRHKLDALMSQFLESASEEPVKVVPVVQQPVIAPVAVAPVRTPADLPLQQIPSAGAPRDLLQSNHGAQPAPSAQQVLDSLNRLMSGLKEISGKQPTN